MSIEFTVISIAGPINLGQLLERITSYIIPNYQLFQRYHRKGL